MSNRTKIIRDVLVELGRLTADAATIDETASLYSAGLSSHASVNVMLALEDEFEVEFPERLLKRATFESIVNLRSAIDSLLGEE